MSEYPQRVEDIEINEVSDGFVVNSPSKGQVHYLNHTAAMLLKLCDGETSVPEMKIIIKDVFELDEAPDAAVDDYLIELEKASLLKS